MDFIEWTTHVLDELLAARREQEEVRAYGILQEHLCARIFGDEAPDTLGFFDSSHAGTQIGAFQSALSSLSRIGLVQFDGFKASRVLATDAALVGPQSLLQSWQMICSKRIEADCQELLFLINRLTCKREKTHVWIDGVHSDQVLKELNWPGGMGALLAASKDLERQGLLIVNGYMDGHLELAAIYEGLVWETRRALTVNAAEIDCLVEEWETTSVDFKQEQHTDTAEQKAELIKDLLGLANTQASGRRWLITGFTDKTHAYYGPPDPKITQQHLEQLIRTYIRPNLTIKYQVVDYYDGRVGKLEVVREPEKLPYSVAKKLTYERRRRQMELAEGEWFVRHSSQTEPPTEDERLIIEEEGERARAQNTGS